MSNNDDNVRQLPSDSASVIRAALNAYIEYMKSTAPKPPDPIDAEVALFDQIVMMQMGFQAAPEEAIERAMTIIAARRRLRASTSTPE